MWRSTVNDGVPTPDIKSGAYAYDVGVGMVCPLLGVVQARPSDVSSGITHIRMSTASGAALLVGPLPQGQLARLAMML